MLSPAVKRFLKYTVVGSTTLIFDLGLLYLLTDLLHLHYVLSAAVAFTISVSINYLLGRKYVFTQTLRSAHAGYFNFMLIALAGLLLVTGGMYMLVEHFSFDYLWARLVIAVLTGFWNYLMNLFVNFKVAGQH